ncbi:ATP-dependent Clp protease proteolytic subunit [Puniceicoccales bacterium CK1056]|uniref:ATP-dependent Clp protease proteolytic subunit n=1 Tax=Oceanipulchritudo coccoides TaxID=2706888 RepID=A0A6B2M1Y5_9BACT|nr:ATP-dependent Clp protease proteolytic subunit [Oceanipulchritudo coccoides]NDV62219.1 ATP-dependent Clp protease proteolytic subunit [Oceanipulchritudo coccoides]
MQFRPTANDETDQNDSPKKLPLSEMMKRKFLEERKIFFWGEVNDKSARVATEELLYLEASDPGKEITLYLNSPGGSITAGMAVYDTMMLITSPIKVVVVGLAASMGSIFLCGGTKGKRFVYPHSRVLIHQPLIMGTMRGAAVDIHIQAQEMEKLREEMNKILSDSSGQPIEQIQKDTDRDFYLNAQEAIDYGLADAIVEKIDD